MPRKKQESIREFVKDAYRPFSEQEPLPHTVRRRLSMWEEAPTPACNNPETAALFAVKRGMRPKGETNAAKRLCQACPLFFECAETTLLGNIRGGITAGMSGREVLDMKQAIGSRRLNALAGRSTLDTERQAFFMITSAVMSVFVLNELTAEEAAVEIAAAHTLLQPQVPAGEMSAV